MLTVNENGSVTLDASVIRKAKSALRSTGTKSMTFGLTDKGAVTFVGHGKDGDKTTSGRVSPDGALHLSKEAQERKAAVAAKKAEKAASTD